MTRPREDVRERIILAAIESIEREGIDAVTTRGIARAAGVNGAAVNYYFGSKQRLVDAALRRTLRNAFSATPDEEAGRGDNPRLVLRSLLSDFLAGSLRYPGLTMAHLYGPLVKHDYRGPVAREFRGFLERLGGLVEAALPAKERHRSRLVVTQVVSSVVAVGLLPGLFEEFVRIEFSNSKAREEYIGQMLDRLIGRGSLEAGKDRPS